MRTFTVYCLYNKYTDEIFYVGATYRKLRLRITEHLKPSRKGVVHDYIEQHGRGCCSYAVLDVCDCLDDLYDREYFWTEYYRKFFYLVNLDSGKMHNESFFKKVSGKNNCNYGKPVPQYMRDRISNALKGHKMSRESIEKGAEKRRGRKHSKEWCENMSKGLRASTKNKGENSKLNIPVILLNTMEEFYSVKNASDTYNVPSTHITANCKHKRQSAGKDKDGSKLVWIYKSEYNHKFVGCSQEG